MLSMTKFCAALLLGLLAMANAEEAVIYRMCVPVIYYKDCLELLKDPSEAGIQMECVAGRDRIDCLDKINERQADVLATEPEDMYVAYHTKNQDYRVISEIRTEDDKDADFRYEGIILVKKNSNIHSLKDLRGAKSCHTGFGRNVGYKIPVTKLKNSNILKVSMDSKLTATERELKALSEFFSESCLVGTYSPYPDTDMLLKEKYRSLCALCEHPEQCNYPDKFSGYDGAIRCLDKGQGEVAFTKVQYIKKYFGLVPNVEAEGDSANYEYLCEDGSRRPVTGPACSWAQRPWTGYISNADSVSDNTKLHNLQHRLERFFENGLHAENKEAASHLLINDNAVYHSKPEAVLPEDYLKRAGYKDVIERDGSEIRKMRFCVETDLEMSKCSTMSRAAYSRDIRPELECVQWRDCIDAVQSGKADIVVVTAPNYIEARNAYLDPIVYESYADDDVYVAIVDPTIKQDSLQTLPIDYDAQNERARFAALFLNKRRSLSICGMIPVPGSALKIVHSSELEKYKDKQLVCPTLERMPVTEMRNCNVEVNLPVAVFIRESMTNVEKETTKHLFISLSSKFGRDSKFADVFTLFGQYKDGANNILFADNAVKFVTELSRDQISEDIYENLYCDRKVVMKQ